MPVHSPLETARSLKRNKISDTLHEGGQTHQHLLREIDVYFIIGKRRAASNGVNLKTLLTSISRDAMRALTTKEQNVTFGLLNSSGCNAFRTVLRKTDDRKQALCKLR